VHIGLLVCSANRQSSRFASPKPNRLAQKISKCGNAALLGFSFCEGRGINRR
jgi:hypothetical protein